MDNFDSDFPPLGSPLPPPSSGKESKEADESWEILTDDAAENDTTGPPAKMKPVVVHGNPKTLRHCASSPDLRHFGGKIYEEDDEEDDEKVEDSSFAMVSNVGSVVSMSSGLSFKDAILASPARQDRTSSTDQNEAPTTNSTAPRPYRKAKMVVVKPPTLMKRCSQSSPNLLGLINEDLEVLGETDAADFYHRKSKGAQGRSNGLKLRPDEAKRKAFSVNKRNLQRQASGAN